jgi:hypothetical protein
MKNDEYFRLVEQTYNLISAELDQYLGIKDPGILMQVFAKFPIMLEFFRFLRGEAFHDQHEPLGLDQEKVYQMEHTLQEKINKLLSQIDYNDSKAKYFLDQSRGIFDRKS